MDTRLLHLIATVIELLRLARWMRSGLLARVHATLVTMVRCNPALIIDGCSVRAKRDRDLTGPNPTDRAKKGTKYCLAVTGDGFPSRM